jgi:UDP-N-acetylglucosamine 1-carboxyvinyltransferase
VQLLIETSRGLKGVYRPQGNKNEALPVIAAALLAGQPVDLANLPWILDVETMLELVASLGASVELDRPGHGARIHAAGGLAEEPDPGLAGRIRGSLLLAPAVLARRGRALLRRPGGDRIGRRPIDTHLAIFEQLGARVELETDMVRLELPGGTFRGADLFLDEASVMATENALMAAAVARGRTVIENAACEPHVQQLCRLLVTLGARVEGIGTNRLQVEGAGGPLGGGQHTLLEDHIEVGSLVALAAATHSAIEIPGVRPESYRMTAIAFRKLGVEFAIENGILRVPAEQTLRVDYERFGAIPRIHDAPWPGFPADLSSIAVVLASCAEGTVLIHEWMFESRLYWVDSLISMGARITQCDPHRVLVNGGQTLRGARLHSPDIRAGMALLIAALRAEGETAIDNVQQIDRGYEAIDQRLAALGAKIRRVN